MSDKNFNIEASTLMAAGRLRDAKTLLEVALRKMPGDWTPIRSVDHQRGLRQRGHESDKEIAFWSQDEFLAYAQSEQRKEQGTIYWVPESYSRAWAQLAFILVEEKDYLEALRCLTRGLQLEPNHPELWSEKGFVLQSLHRNGEALQCYVRAASVRAWAPRTQISRALRGQGINLIELGRVDEAVCAFEKSLELEPGNNIAIQELEYIAQLMSGQVKQVQAVPWFMHSFVAPPTDPLTIRLAKLVEDLEGIPGPKTVGPENYDRISRAFIEFGWAGFECEFDRTFPRTDPEYAAKKRDLLRAPLFKIKVHDRMMRLVAGEISSDEALKEANEAH
jgi:tetratricopeptide (TPR) repeat protein